MMMRFKGLLSTVIGYPVDGERRLRVASFCLTGGLIAAADFLGIIRYDQLARSWRSLSWILWRHHLGAFETHFWIALATYGSFVIWPSQRIAKAKGLKPHTIWAMALPAFLLAFLILTKLFEPNIQY